MQYEICDILTIDNLKYAVVSKVLFNNAFYYMLSEVDEDENIKSNNLKIYKQIAVNNLEPDKLYPIDNIDELNEVTTLLNDSLLNY